VKPPHQFLSFLSLFNQIESALSPLSSGRRFFPCFCLFVTVRFLPQKTLPAARKTLLLRPLLKGIVNKALVVSFNTSPGPPIGPGLPCQPFFFLWKIPLQRCPTGFSRGKLQPPRPCPRIDDPACGKGFLSSHLIFSPSVNDCCSPFFFILHPPPLGLFYLLAPLFAVLLTALSPDVYTSSKVLSMLGLFCSISPRY